MKTITQTARQLAERELPEGVRELETLRSAIQARTGQIAALEASIARAREALADARDGRTQAQVERNEKQSAHDAARSAANEAVERWAAALAASGFDAEHEFVQRYLPVEQMDELERQIETYITARIAANTELANARQAVAGHEPPDVDHLQRLLAAARSERDDIVRDFHTTNGRLSQLQSAALQLESYRAQQLDLERQYGVVGTLAEVASGKNPHRMNLQTFVLSVLLEDVLTIASVHLTEMSKGRYRLVRFDGVRHQGMAAGLELEVEDTYTGKNRPVATLSGGESFLAALSLALGLSEIVQSYAGGIRLDTLFIDEGFGSLDPDSLELAINTLLELKSSGRMVGIISHVEDLKHRIDVRLDVRPAQSGSRVQAVLP